MKNNLKTIREMNGKRQEDVARDLDVPLPTYRSWEQGGRGLNGEKLIVLAGYFNVTTDTILGSQFSDLETVSIMPDETELLDLYRSLNGDGRKMALAIIGALVRSGDYDK